MMFIELTDYKSNKIAVRTDRIIGFTTNDDDSSKCDVLVDVNMNTVERIAVSESYEMVKEIITASLVATL